MPRRATAICLILTATILVIYWPAFYFGFVNFDDYDYITTNPNLSPGLTWQTARWAFTTFYTSNYFPLTWISFLNDSSLFRLNPHAMHIENVLLHAGCAILLFFGLLKATDQLWPSAFAAALFAVHPTHVESVAWITERKDVLSTFFLLAALNFYLHYSRPKKANRGFAYASMLFCFACALLSKTMPVTFPFALLLLDYWPLYRTRSCKRLALLIEKIPLLLMSVFISFMTYQSQRSIIAPISAFPLQIRFGNAMLSYLGYLSKEFWPANLSVLYPLRSHISLTLAYGSAAIILCLTILFAAIWRTRPYAIVGWLWFLGTMVPVIGIIQVGIQSMADRFLYIPSIGLTIMLTWTARDLLIQISPKVVAALGASILLILAIVSHHQVYYWRDGYTLFEHASMVLNGNEITEVRLGQLAAREGNITQAERHYQSALKLDPANYAAELDLGNLFINTDPRRAIDHFRQATINDPTATGAQLNWGVALLNLKDPANAFDHFRTAESLDPRAYDPHYNLAQMYLSAHRVNEARNEFSLALQARPGDSKALKGLQSAQTEPSK